MSDLCKNWSEWLTATRFSYMQPEQREQTLRWLEAVREEVMERAEIQEGQTVIDIGTGTGLLAFKALEILNGTGEVIFSDKFQDCLISCEKFLKDNGITQGYRMLQAPIEALGLPENSVDTALTRSVLVHVLEKQPAINEIYRVLKEGGRYCAFEPIISSNTRYSQLINPVEVRKYDEFRVVEDEMMTNPKDPLTNFDANTLTHNLNVAGFRDGMVQIQDVPSTYKVEKGMVKAWFDAVPAPDKPSSRQRYMQYFSEKDVNNFIKDVEKCLTGTMVTTLTKAVFINAIK